MSGVWARFRPALPWWVIYTVALLAADRIQDVDLLPVLLLLAAGVALGEAVRRFRR